MIKLEVLAHLVYQPKSVIESCFVRHASSLASLSSVHTSPSHRIKHRNSIFGTKMHIKYLAILTYVCYILVIFFDWQGW